MCGVFGVIGKPNQYVLRSLALINRERGTHSLGYFCSDLSRWRCGGDPLELIQRKSYRKYAKRFKNCWYVVGHTRWATRGKHTTQNAHPFKSGPYIGVHNGVVDAPMKYRVDSKYIWHLLHKHDGDYMSAWRELPGHWSLIWTDSKSLYLQTVNQDLAVCRIGNSVYFSSDEYHLGAVTGQRDITTLTSGETWKFDSADDAEQLADMVRDLPPVKTLNYKGRVQPSIWPGYIDDDESWKEDNDADLDWRLASDDHYRYCGSKWRK